MSPWGEGGGYVPEEARRGPEQEKKDEPAPPVPENELQFTFSASGGPGGQNVNKVASKATLRWSVGESAAYTDEQKEAIREYAGQYLNKNDEVVIQANEQRSQHQNKDAAIARLQNMVAQALVPKKERKETKPSYGAKQRRLDEKGKESRKKQERRKGPGEW